MKKKYTKYILLAALVVLVAVIAVWYAVPVPFVSKDVVSADMRNARIGSGEHVEISSQQCEQIFEVLKDYQDNIVLSGNVYIDETYYHLLILLNLICIFLYLLNLVFYYHLILILYILMLVS